MQVQDARRVREAADALAAAVAEMDLGSMLPAAHRELVALGERIERTGRTVKSMAAAKVAESAVWRGDGDRSPEDWLARTTGTTRAEAAKELQCGRDLQLVPEVAKAATAGELSVKQTEAIAGAAAVDPHRRGPAPRQRQGQGPAGAAGRVPRHPHQRRPRSRGHPGPDPRQAVLPHVDRPRRHRPPPPLRPQRRHRSAGQRRAPPLRAHLPRRPPRRPPRAHRRLRLRRGRRAPHQRGDSTPVPAGADAKIIVRVDLPALLRGRAVDGETCEIAGLGPIPVSIVKEWMDDAFLAAVVTKGTEITKVVHLGRRFTSEQRTALQWRDPVCARKGCYNRLGLEYDHFEDWALTRTTRVEPGGGSARPATASRRCGWTVSEPDADGQCTFTPPPTGIRRHRRTRPPARARRSHPSRPPGPPRRARPPEAPWRPALARRPCPARGSPPGCSVHEPVEQPARPDHLGVARAHAVASPRSAVTTITSTSGAAWAAAMAAIVSSPSPDAWSTSTPSATASSAPFLAWPSSTTVTGGSSRPAATDARTRSVELSSRTRPVAPPARRSRADHVGGVDHQHPTSLAPWPRSEPEALEAALIYVTTRPAHPG